MAHWAAFLFPSLSVALPSCCRCRRQLAQSTNAALDGTIKDGQGGVLPGRDRHGHQ